jgi:hypothetical protein
MNSASRRTPFYWVLVLATISLAVTSRSPDMLPAFQTWATLVTLTYAGMVGHHAVTKERKDDPSQDPS